MNKQFIELNEDLIVNIEYVLSINLTPDKQDCWVKFQEGEYVRNFKLPSTKFKVIRKQLLEYEGRTNGQ